MGHETGQDLLLNRTVLNGPEPVLRGPFRLRLASACDVSAQVRRNSAQSRTRVGATTNANAVPSTTPPPELVLLQQGIVRVPRHAMSHQS